ncbi:MAG: hypothetical protein FWG94_01715 [Oscillospiraceae bacterium]|nr:hypothetical protein [Oscillospiraceae bacterium]
MLRFPTSNDIYIEINGKKIAVAQGYRTQTSRDSRYVEAFGHSEPVGTVGGRQKHILELIRVVVSADAIGDGIDFYGLSKFNVVIAKPDRKIIYSDCEWAQIEENGSLGNVVLESVSIVASRRMELES